MEAVDGSSKLIEVVQVFDKFILGGYLGNRVAAREATQRRIEAELGPWYDFLHENGIYFKPILSAHKFDGYMRNCKGAFRPVGESMATAAWTHFLHGLGITPEHKVVARRPFEGPANAEITLEVDGQVIAHVINLLELENAYVTPRHRDGASKGQPNKPSGNGLYQTQIRDIKFTHNAESHIANLTFRPMNGGNKVHHFFGLKTQDPDIVMVRYDLAVKDLGVSDASLAWPPAGTHIPERLRVLLEIRKKVQGSIIPVNQRPVFVTESWHKGAERIRHRAVGGDNAHVLLADAFDNVQGDEGPDCVLAVLKSWILEPYPLDYGDWDKSMDTGPAVEAESAIRQTLQSYGKEPLGSWKHDLSLYRERLYDLGGAKDVGDRFDMSKDVIRILSIDSATKLWQRRELIMEMATTVKAGMRESLSPLLYP